MPRIERLGHVGIHVNDLDAMTDFYTRVIGLSVTDDQRADRGMIFLTSDRRREHHELFLIRGRDVPRGAVLLHQVSFRAPSLEDVQAYLERLKAEGAEIEETVNHGMAIGVYFYDPEGNRCEIYWDTTVRDRKAFRRPIDLERSASEVLSEAQAMVEETPLLAAG